jgi:predicted dehydrogenase
MSAKLRVALAGAGMISRHHLIAWGKCGGAEVVAVADPLPEKARGRAREFAVEHVFDQVETMLDDIRPDAVDIASPVDTHVAIAEMAARRGIPVLCQKPLAPTIGKARALAATAARVPFMAHENWRFRAPYRLARSWIRQGLLGEVRRFAVTTESSGLIAREGGVAPAVARQPFFASMPRLMIFEVLIHHLDVARALCGELSVVAAETAHTTPAIPGDDRAVILLRGGGCIGVVTGDYAVPGVPATASDTVEVVGDRGRLTYDGEALRLFHASGDVVVERFVREEVYQSAFDNAIAHFVHGVLHREPFETSLEDNLETFALVEAAYASAALARRAPGTVAGAAASVAGQRSMS